MALLEVRTPGGQILIRPLSPDAPLLIGTLLGSDIRLQGPQAAPLHCRVSWNGTNYEVTAGTANGVDVNGTLVARRLLHFGDMIFIGPLEVEFREGTAAELAEAGASAPFDEYDEESIEFETLPTPANYTPAPPPPPPSQEADPREFSADSSISAPVRDVPRQSDSAGRSHATSSSASPPWRATPTVSGMAVPPAPVDSGNASHRASRSASNEFDELENEHDEYENGDDENGEHSGLIVNDDLPVLLEEPGSAVPREPSQATAAWQSPVTALPSTGSPVTGSPHSRESSFREPKPVEVSKPCGFRRRPGEQDLLASPLVLGFGGLALVLLLASGVIWFLIGREGADRLYAGAVADEESGKYSQAIQRYEEFLLSYPADERTASARLGLGFARIQRYMTGAAPAWNKALEEFNRFIANVRDQPEFANERDRLRDLARTLANGAAASAERTGERRLLAFADQGRRLFERFAARRWGS